MVSLRTLKWRAWKEANPERAKAISRASSWKYQHGEYILLDYCERDKQYNRPQRSSHLLAHHTHFDSCGDCFRTQCKRLDHQMTVCISCHHAIHKRARWMNEKEFARQNQHMRELAWVAAD